MQEMYGQLPPFQPEQDCFQAIPVCSPLYFQSLSYTGEGVLGHEINPLSSCLLTGEKNSVWYQFTVSSPGEICFSLIPLDSTDDYDWALFDLTQASCSDIFSQPNLLKACNYYPALPACGSVTGANGNISGPCAAMNEACIQVTGGEKFVLNVSNYTGSQNGYWLDFSASTASILDTLPPEVSSFLDSCDGKIKFYFSEPVSANQLSLGSFYLLDSMGGQFFPTQLLMNTSTVIQDLSIQFADSLTLGQYRFVSSLILEDLCGNLNQIQDTIPLLIGKRLPFIPLPQLICNLDSLLIQVEDIPGISYRWENGGTHPDTLIHSLSQQWIHLEARLPNGCIVDDSIFLDPVMVPEPVIFGDSTVCAGNRMHFFANSFSSEYQKIWTLNGNTVQGLDSVSIDFQEDGIFDLSLQISNQNCLSNPAHHLIEVFPMPVNEILHSGDRCFSADEVEFEIGNYHPSWSYEWAVQEKEAFSDQQKISVLFPDPGKKFLSLQSTTAGGCTSVVHDSIQLFSLHETEFWEDSICANDTLQIPDHPSLEKAFFQSLSSENQTIAADDSFRWAQLPPGSWEISWVATYEPGCQDTLREQIFIQKKPEFTIDSGPFCAGQENEIRTYGQESYSYHWEDPELGILEGQVFVKTFDQEGPYEVELMATDSNGCSDQQAFQFYIEAAPLPFPVFRDTVCKGENAYFTLEPNDSKSIFWQQQNDTLARENRFVSRPIFESDTFFVSGLAANGCKIPASRAIVDVWENFQPEYRLDTSSVTDFKIRGMVENPLAGANYTWEWGDGSSQTSVHAWHQYQLPGTFQPQLTVWYEGNCEVEIPLPEIEFWSSPIPFIPSAFSPNGDGNNDLFAISSHFLENVRFEVYNRWGKTVFYTNRNSVDWNGKDLNGNPLASGNYVFLLQAVNHQGNRINKRGVITLIR